MCTSCGRDYRTAAGESGKTRNMYRVVHYMCNLLNALQLTDPPPSAHEFQVIEQKWVASGHAALNKNAIQKLLETRRERTYRHLLRKWRHITFRFTGKRPPYMSIKARKDFSRWFLKLHGAFMKCGLGAKKKSFINFPLAFRRCFEFIGQDVFKDYMPGLKSVEKHCKHYGMYAKMCRYADLPIVIEYF